MIQTHKFNTRWWGRPVGVVADKSFFDLEEDERAAQLAAFDWVEYRQRLDIHPLPEILLGAGFFQADTQLSFLLNLARVEQSPSTSDLETRTASQAPFDVSTTELAPFQHERFLHIPGCTQSRTNQRYALWANDLIASSPQTCLQIWLGDHLQGWFLSRPTRSNHLELTLAMLAKDARVSGMLLYHKACITYAGMGYRVGEASFSATNSAVHNIYARLGARFTAPSGNWLWIADQRQGES